jgi:hypothetical protein
MISRCAFVSPIMTFLQGLPCGIRGLRSLVRRIFHLTAQTSSHYCRTLFFLFYFNRVFATLISYGLRQYTWRFHQVYIDIQALQISLLGGRVFFKGFRYHGNNETILIHSGYITWSYWLRNVRELELGHEHDEKQKYPLSATGTQKNGAAASAEVEGGGISTPPRLPCRFNASFRGAEWFVYNRSAAYDAVVAGMMQEDSDLTVDVPGLQKEESDSLLRKRKRARPTNSEKRDGSTSDTSGGDSQFKEKGTSGMQPEDSKLHTASTSRTETSDSGRQQNSTGQEGGWLLRMLPIYLECEKAAVVLGNENTKSVLITKADKVSGEIDASRSGVLDHYRQLFNFHFVHPVIQMKPNDDYKEDQIAAAERIKRGEADQPEPKAHHVHTHSYFHRQRRRAFHKLQDLVPVFRRSVESFSSGESPPRSATESGANGHNWQGLSRYLDESEQDDKARWSSIEYATVPTIVDSPEATMSFFWDVVGTVPDHGEEIEPVAASKNRKSAANINGDYPPQYGLDLKLKGAIVNYGPWADRQRADIQRVFFPSLSKDATPAKKLQPGQLRIPTEFKVYIEFDAETILRVPIKEESKNWKWSKQADVMGTRKTDHGRNGNKSRKRKTDKGNPGPEIRPFGWLDIKVGPNTTVTYVMDMIASSSGFSNKVELNLPNVEITTSVNHGVLLRTAENHISCDLSNPLQWNGHHSWTFDITSTKLELFVLREHIFLLTDLVDDWASGPPPEYLTFSPFRYLVNLHFPDFQLYLNVNDANIINNPSDFEDNSFIIIFGEFLNANLIIPLDNYRPHRNDISFDVDARHGGLRLHVPPWNTQATFLSSNEIAQLKTLSIKGKYQYCATTSSSNTDTLLLDVHGHAPTAHFYGFIIRYYLKVKDNYFGDDIHFRTLEEYQEVLRTKRGEAVDNTPVQPHKKSNDLDVVISVSADESAVILPANLYSARNHTRIEIADLAADLRFTNYYMDLEVTLDTLAFSQGNLEDGSATPAEATSGTQLFIDGVAATGNRLFGLPPLEPTYVCNWDFTVGAVTGECTTEFFSRLSSGVRGLAFSFDDDENALPSILDLALHDVTFLRAYIESVRVWLHVEDAAFLMSTSNISVNFNDWAGSHYSQKLKLSVPDLQLACVDAESASRHRSRAHHPVETHALIKTALSLVMIQRKLGFTEDRQLQQEHIKRHDQRTHRAEFLLHNEYLDDSMLILVDPPAMTVPSMPSPISKDDENGYLETRSIISARSSLSRENRFFGRKSSFLSISGSSQKSGRSIIRGQSSVRHGEQSHTGSRTRSLQTGKRGPGFHIPNRDVSVSSGRKSSFYSAVGDYRGLPTSSVTFSSSYMAPYFPLEGVEPDMKDLPTVSSEHRDEFSTETNQMGLEDIDTNGLDDTASYVSFLLELESGITGVLNPKAAGAILELLAEIQPADPVDIMDDLQVVSLNEIFDIRKQKIKSGTITDFNLRTPNISLRFLNSAVAEPSRTSHKDKHDQYDLSMSGLSLTTRTKTLAADAAIVENARNSSAMHLSLFSARISAKERFDDIDDAQAAVNGVLEDVVFWTASADDNSASIVFKIVEITTASSKIEYLASLVHRTNVLANTLEDAISSQLSQQKKRLQLFAYLVATAGQDATDPLFLTRPSYVLRSAPDHLRTSDSWKIVTRLHHMYTSLDPVKKQDIVMSCLQNSEVLPQDAQQRVLASFTKWRGWDLNNIHTCLMLARIFGPSERIENRIPQKSRPLKISFRTELVRLVLDPGPKQSEISLSLVTSTVESKVKVSQHTGTTEGEQQPMQSTILQVFCADISINLNWELCELADDILKLYLQSEPQPHSPGNRPAVPSGHPKPAIKHNLHVIVATEKGAITIDTINIRAVSISEGLKASFVMVNEQDGDLVSVANLMLAADAATSQVKSHSQELTLYQLREPSVYASYEAQVLDGESTNIIKLAANCQEISFVVRQDVLALIDVLDLIIGDEVAQLHELTKGIPSSKSKVPQSKPSASPTINRINIALFLDRYHVSIPLLHTLTYNITGVVARASIAAQLKSEIVFDFDIKEHSHDIKTFVNDRTQSISLLHMPPTNGRVTTHMSEEENAVSVYASIEPVEIDAAAIHSLLTAINKPEVSSALTDIQEEVRGIRIHLEEIFGHDKKPVIKKVSSDGKPFIYEAHLTLAGFDIFAESKGVGSAQRTRLDLNLGCVQLVLSNRLDHQGPVLEFPELRVGLRHIKFELARAKAHAMEPCGHLALTAFLTATSKINEAGEEVRSFHLKSDSLEINLFSETASSVVDVIGHLQDKIKDLEPLSLEKKYLRKLRKSKSYLTINDDLVDGASTHSSSIIFASMYSLELLNIQVCWLVETLETPRSSLFEPENLVLSLKRIDLSTRKENSARLTIEGLQLQMVPSSHDKNQRSLNSALLPEIIFNVGYVSTIDARRFAFQAAGKSLDLRLTSQFMIPVSKLQNSIRSARDKVRVAIASWTTSTPDAPTTDTRRKPFFGKKRMESLLVDADFAGAVVYLSGKKVQDTYRDDGGRVPQTGKYGQFTHSDASSNTALRSPGLAWKIEYKDNGVDEPSLNAEVKVDASSNILYPAVVPLIMEISSTVKEMVSDEDQETKLVSATESPQKFMSSDDDNILTTDPSAVLGRTRLNLGVRICKQEFTLSCQPIARVAATARFDDIYLTVNTVRSTEHGHFFAVSAAFTKLQASVQHVYSRESTGSFDVDSVFLSLMNSKHVSGTSGVSAILKISPMKVLVNAKQLQDFLLFREIWVPVEVRQSAPTPSPATANTQTQTFLVQRYQQVAATGAFPWNATVSIAELNVQLDLGQALGKSTFMISNFWVSSKKSSDWEQNLCMGFDKVGVNSTGRMSGFVTLQDFRIRTSIQWPAREMALNQTPLIQGSMGFSQFRVKAAFDYQAFLVADITSFEFLMYNVRNTQHAKGDRLVAIVDGETVQVFCTTTTAAQGLALYQAFLRLVQEKRTNYEASLSEIEKFMKRKSASQPLSSPQPKNLQSEMEDKAAKSPISLHTDVIVTLKTVNIGAFPNTFSDHQVFKLEALDAQARFAVTMDNGKIHSILGLTLGQLRIGLAGVKRIDSPKSVSELSVEDVVSSATGSRGGTILKVPKVEATMQTWQNPSSNHIDYIFKSSFSGKVEVGWNYSRISYIRGMWASHSKALAQRLGKPLPSSGIKITGVPGEEERKEGEQQKITAEVNVPQSKYDYTALEPPIIETPQLRDMGEAVSRHDALLVARLS